MDWATLEEKVRDIASLLWERPAAPEYVAGVRLDCVVKIEPQKGNGRMEEALTRGLGAVADNRTVQRVLKLLVTEKLLRKVAGDQGNVYVPIRAMTNRMKTMVSELALSKDPLWTAVGEFK